MAGEIGLRNEAVYSGAKTGIIAFTKALASEEADFITDQALSVDGGNTMV